MSKIQQLFDEKFVLELLEQKVLPLYPKYGGIKKMEIKEYKNMVWEERYHVVLEFRTDFIKKEGGHENVSIFCSAHSSEPRENVYVALRYLWDKGFHGEGIDIPKPLFFSEEFKGIFYEGVQGENLYQYIKCKDFAVIEKMIVQSAKMFARLHSLPADEKANINPINSRIETSVPGVEAIYQKMFEHYGQDNPYSADLKKMYDYFISQEEKFLTEKKNLRIIHGDAHSENVIRTGEDTIGLIDFTDLCLGDFARDLGTFLQQFEYKMVLKVVDYKKTQEMKNLFMETYLEARGIELDSNLRERIDLYYDWTAIRSAIFLFLKYDNDPSAGEALFQAVKTKLNI